MAISDESVCYHRRFWLRLLVEVHAHELALWPRHAGHGSRLRLVPGAPLPAAHKQKEQVLAAVAQPQLTGCAAPTPPNSHDISCHRDLAPQDFRARKLSRHYGAFKPNTPKELQTTLAPSADAGFSATPMDKRPHPAEES
eukprot:6210817-Pleurochrysis_carterae.AAC.3